MLSALSIYQIISCAASIILFAGTLLFSKGRFFSGPLAYLAFAIVLAVNVYVIYINAEYLTKPKQTVRFRAVNRWFNFLQIFHLSLFGLVFSFVNGLSFTPEFRLYANGSYWGVLLNFFNISFDCSYHFNDKDIAAGINLVPAAYLIMFHYYRHSDETPETLDLFTLPSRPLEDLDEQQPKT